MFGVAMMEKNGIKISIKLETNTGRNLITVGLSSMCHRVVDNWQCAPMALLKKY